MKGTEKGRASKTKSTGMIWKIGMIMVLLTFLLIAGAAQLMLMGILPEKGTTAIAATTVGIVSFVSAMYSAIKMKERRMLFGLVSTLAYCLCLLMGNLLFFGVGYGNVIPVLLTAIIAGIVGSFLGAAKKPKKKYA